MSEGVPTVLSLGGGVNSVAMLLYLHDKGTPPDYVVFGDTGEEQPHTWAAVRHIDQNIQEVQVVRKRAGLRLVSWYHASRAIPFVTKRSCTDQFKIRPVRRWMRSVGLNDVDVLLGIAADEPDRLRDSNVKWARNVYPLATARITRKGCHEIIERLWDGPPVKKSGCMGCPLAGQRGYARLYQENPAEFARWRAMEEAGRNYPKDRLLVRGPTLASLAHRFETETSLDAFLPDGDNCEEGYCFT